MCFSAGASFTTSALLSLGSIAALSKVHKKSSIMVASMPLFFAVQQCAEGIVWLSYSYPAFEPFRTVASYTFLAFAFVFWPIWIPLSLHIAETNKKRKYILLALLLAGILLALYMLAHFIMYGIGTTITDCNINYQMDITESLVILNSIVYITATIAPFFISSIARMWLLGVAMAVSYLVAYVFYYYVFISVWCFFAALLSIIIFSILPLRNKK